MYIFISLGFNILCYKSICDRSVTLKCLKTIIFLNERYVTYPHGHDIIVIDVIVKRPYNNILIRVY